MLEDMKIYASIGGAIKVRRKQLSMSQMILAEKIGISYQQIQKYEYGTARISVSRLVQLAEALEMPVESFFNHRPVKKGRVRGCRRGI